MRIASVLPSATEIVAALGAADELVARSAECDYPASVRSLPVLMRARTLDQERPSGEIDRRVRSARGAGESLYRIDTDILRATAPDVLFTQDLCGVCSVTGEEVAAAARSAGVSPRIVSLVPRTLEDVFASIGTIGRAIARESEARDLVVELQRRSAPGPRAPRARLAVVEWLDPPILAGLWTPEIVERAGGIYVGPRPGEVGERTTWEGIASARPDAVVVSPCSFSVERTLREARAGPISAQVRAVLPRTPIWVADEAYFSRPGPRLVHGVELVRSLLGSDAPPAHAPLEVRTWDESRSGALA